MPGLGFNIFWPQRFLGARGTQPVSYLVDDFSPQYAYSIRRLSSTYTGYAFRIRRSSDNAEKDFYFDGDEFTLNSKDNTNTTLASWIGSNDGYVVYWYDQVTSGTTYVAYNLAAGNQPKIISSGAFIVDGSAISIDFDSNDSLLINNTTSVINSVFTVARVEVQTSANYVVTGVNGGYLYNGSAGGVNGLSGFDGSNVRSISGEDLNRHLGFFNVSGGNLFIGKDGAATSNTGSFTSFTINQIGQRLGLYLDGKIQEIVLFTSEQSSNYSSIASNINNYYGIY